MSWALGAAALTSFLGSRSAKKAERRRLAAIEARRREMEALYLPKLGKQSRILAGLYEEQKQGITQAGAGERARSRAYWKRAGNIGRARGEEMRTGLATQEALNRAALGYGQAEEERQERVTGALAAIKMGTLPYEAQAIAGQGEAQQGLFQDFQGILGNIAGAWQMGELLKTQAKQKPLPGLPPQRTGFGFSLGPELDSLWLPGMRGLQSLSYSRREW